MGKYIVKQTKTGFNFALKAVNGEIIGTSEVYTVKKSCLNGVASVKENAPIAKVENQTEKDFAKEGCPKFEVYNDKKGEVRFRLKAKNGQIILASEGYTTLKACLNGIESVKKNADSPVVEEE